MILEKSKSHKKAAKTLLLNYSIVLLLMPYPLVRKESVYSTITSIV